MHQEVEAVSVIEVAEAVVVELLGEGVSVVQEEAVGVEAQIRTLLELEGVHHMVHRYDIWRSDGLIVYQGMHGKGL